MLEYINLFKALPVATRTPEYSPHFISDGVMVEGSVMATYGADVIRSVIDKLVPKNSDINKTFHKSWKKVRDASLEQLVMEQTLHYFTTYGLESMGLYNEDSVYIPNEVLKLDEEGGITFLVIRGITPEEMNEKVTSLLRSGLALSDSDLDDLIVTITEYNLTVDPADSANREMKVRLYDKLNIVPADPVEFLRLQVYRTTESSLLIKDKATLEKLSAVKKNVFTDYKKAHNLTGLASVFHRFKPIFLALKNNKSASTVNRIRKLAVKYHKPLPEDYLASVTKHLRAGDISFKQLRASLKNANVFRKVKLLQALKLYENKNLSGIVYSVRNGRSFTTTTTPIGSTQVAQATVCLSLAQDLKHLKGKKVYLDANLAVPTSGKMFVGDVPVGSSFTTKNSLALGVSWKDVKDNRVDLDLSLLSVGGKIGWDGGYRNDDLLFSGDITSAPHGATEAHLVRQDAHDGIYLLDLNYYNAYDTTVEVPFTLFVAEEKEYKRLNKNALVSKDNMLFWADSTINASPKQKTIGVLRIKDGTKTFYVFESKTGNRMSSRRDEKTLQRIDFFDKSLDSFVRLQDLLEWSGAKLVDLTDGPDIDLSLNALTKIDLVDLLTAKK